MGEEGLGKEGEVSTVMTVITKLDAVAEAQVEECDGQSNGAAREQDAGAESERSSGLCPIVPLNTAAVVEDQRRAAADGNQEASQNATDIRSESLNGEDAKENRESAEAPESHQGGSECKNFFTELFSTGGVT